MNTLTISQLGKQVNLSPKTIRFYEEEGLLTQPERLENGYRSYSPDLVEQLRLIKQARDLGLPLQQIKKLMKGCEGRSCEHTQQEVKTELTEFLSILETKILQFSQLKEKLKQLQNSVVLDTQSCDSGKYCCNFLYQLTETKKGGGTPMSNQCTCCGSKCECTDKDCNC